MEIKKKKCSFEDHRDIDAIIYCKKCEIYLCNKCEAYHTKLCKNHQTIILGKDTEIYITGYCKEENHYDKLEYFCKNHNQLCCSACIAKIKGKGKGQHTDCNICFIEDIKDEMKNKLKDNIKLSYFLYKPPHIFTPTTIVLKLLKKLKSLQQLTPKKS